MFLEQIGADNRVRALFAALGTNALELARVCFAAKEQYRVYLEDGEEDAVPSGHLRWNETLPALGDWVAVQRTSPGMPRIEHVLRRGTCVARRPAGTAVDQQIIAANVDVVAVVCGLDHDFNLRRIERYLILVRESGADPLLVLNKCDLARDPQHNLTEVVSVAPGVPVLMINAIESVEKLREAVQGRTVAFLGSSGAGKSTIINGLLGRTAQLTSGVRRSDSRGRHATTHRMLFPLPGGGAIIDNPGMRELQLLATEESLNGVFEDIAALARNCRFADCSHDSEPDCAVQAARDEGTLDLARWTSYRKLAAEVRYQQREQDIHLKLNEKKKWKAIHKAARHDTKRNW